jgi:hypothetical protein
MIVGFSSDRFLASRLHESSAMSRFLLSVTVVCIELAAPACTSSEGRAATDDTADDMEPRPGDVEIVPRGFIADSGFIPIQMAFQFVSERDGDAWVQGPPGDAEMIDIEYGHIPEGPFGKFFANHRVAVRAPDGDARLLKMAFKLGFVGPGPEDPKDLTTWQPAQYIDLDAERRGRMFSLELTQFILSPDDPFPRCFDGSGRSIAIEDLGGGTFEIAPNIDKDVDGLIDRVFYGFTAASSEEFCGPGDAAKWRASCERRDVPWLNSSREEIAESHISPTYFRVAFTNKLAPMWVWTPESLNLIWRV